MSGAARHRTPRPSVASAAQPTPPPAQVRLGWLLGALGLLLLAALCCAYLSLCLLFLQGQWQLLYQPQQHKLAAQTPASLGLAFSAIQFSPNQAGISELTGWWLPATGAAPAPTILYLHGAAGSLSDTLPALQRIHALGCSIFAIDYRGYGASTAAHPSEAGMVADAQQAVSYLTDTRHLAPGSIVLWGQGSGATIAAQTSSAEQLTGHRLAVVLEEPNLPALTLIERDPRTRWLPVRLLLRDRLDPAAALSDLHAPKLFLGSEGASAGPASRAKSEGYDSLTLQARLRMLYADAAEPKEEFINADPAAIQHFLSEATRPWRLSLQP